MLINWIDKLPFNDVTKLKMLNLLYFFSFPKRTAYMEYPITEDAMVCKEVLDTIREYKKQGRSYASCYEYIEAKMLKRERKHNIILLGWERLIRTSWDDMY